MGKRFLVLAGQHRVTLLLIAVLGWITLLAYTVAVLLWSPRCEAGRRIAIGEALLLGGCDGPQRLAPSQD